MSGHFPFTGNADRIGIHAFYDKHGLGLALQEKYYRWWYEWAKRYVLADPGLRASKGAEFQRFPFGQHALHDFHLHGYRWCTTLADLGGFIDGTLLRRLSDQERHRLEDEHAALLESLKREIAEHPKETVPDVGVFRHT
jgi:hypothetical protein